MNERWMDFTIGFWAGLCFSVSLGMMIGRASAAELDVAATQAEVNAILQTDIQELPAVYIVDSLPRGTWGGHTLRARSGSVRRRRRLAAVWFLPMKRVTRLPSKQGCLLGSRATSARSRPSLSGLQELWSISIGHGRRTVLKGRIDGVLVLI